MTWRICICLIAAFVGTGGFTAFAAAQAATATLGGTVVDENGALVADARVIIVNPGTALERQTATGPEGRFVAALLPPGRYILDAQRDGFATTRLEEIVLNVGDDVTVRVVLKVRGIDQTVTVTGVPSLASTSATVATVVDRQFAANLPLNGRSFQTLILLTPGVTPVPTGFNDQGQFSVNGQRADANYFMVDGVSANFGATGYFPMMQTAGGALPALSANGGTNSLVSVEAMQEFRVQTSTFAPEFGRTPGGQVSIVTRSGTNAFHGSLFEYFRNNALDSEDWFVKTNNLPKPEERMHDLGGVAGGPIARDSTFFFLSYEGLRLHQPSSQQTTVPDAASRLHAPISIRPYLNAFPVPNGRALGQGLAEFDASFSNPSTLSAYSAKFDHVVNAKLSVFGRYNYSPSSFDQRGGSFSSGPVLSATNSVSSTVHTLTAGVTQLIGQRITNEIRANYSSHTINNEYSMDNFGNAAPLQDSQLFPAGYSSKNSAFLLLITGVGEYALGQFATDEQRQVNLVDNLSVVSGSHQLKFGVDYRRLAPFSNPFAYRNFVQFSGVTAAPGGVLSGTAAFVQPGAFQPNSLRSQNFSLYGQDTWTVSPRLTVTYGVRWDCNPPLKGKDLNNQPFTVIGLSDPATMTLAPRGTPLYQTTFGNVVPRLGLAYVLTASDRWQAVLRGGFGTFYDLGQGTLGGVTSYFPYGADKVIPSPTPFPLNAQDAAPPPFTLDPPINTILVADPRLKLPRSYQWNVALEQSLGRNQSVSATYVGAAGRDLLRVTTLVNPNPTFQSVVVTDNSASSDYRALQLKFQRRLSHGVQGLASYTLAHSTDNASTDAGTYRSTPGASGAAADRGDSDFDIRHTFTTGATWMLPSGASSGVTRVLLRGWSLDAFVFARSAPPVDVLGAITFAGGTALASRPNVNPGVPLERQGPQYASGKIFNRAAFTAAAAGQQGNFGRNVLRGFGASQMDLAVQRQLQVAGRTALLLRVECFNVFNQSNFGSPNNTLTSPMFGYSTQTLANSLGSGGANGGFSPLYQIGGPRSVQLALRLEF